MNVWKPTFLVLHEICLSLFQPRLRVLDKHHHAAEVRHQDLLHKLLGPGLQELSEAVRLPGILRRPLLVRFKGIDSLVLTAGYAVLSATNRERGRVKATPDYG